MDLLIERQPKMVIDDGKVNNQKLAMENVAFQKRVIEKLTIEMWQSKAWM